MYTAIFSLLIERWLGCWCKLRSLQRDLFSLKDFFDVDFLPLERFVCDISLGLGEVTELFKYLFRFAWPFLLDEWWLRVGLTTSAVRLECFTSRSSSLNEIWRWRYLSNSWGWVYCQDPKIKKRSLQAYLSFEYPFIRIKCLVLGGIVRSERHSNTSLQLTWTYYKKLILSYSLVFNLLSNEWLQLAMFALIV